MENLTNSQRSALIENFVDLVINGMDTKTLMQVVADNMTEYYEKCSDIELKEEIDNHDETLYKELIESITTVKEA